MTLNLSCVDSSLILNEFSAPKLMPNILERNFGILKPFCFCNWTKM